MKNPILSLNLQHASHITNGNHELIRLVAHFYTYGGIRYSADESPEITVRFLDMVPCTGDALHRLFLESDKTFEEFVTDVIAGKYLWYAVGQSISSFAGIQLNLARIALRHSAQMVSAIFSPPINSE